MAAPFEITKFYYYWFCISDIFYW